jgi:transcriptional regulator with XRE-family HTH domain
VKPVISVRKHRKRIGYSQYELAKKIGVTRAAVQMWELNRCYPGLPTLVKLLKILGITLDELLH